MSGDNQLDSSLELPAGSSDQRRRIPTYRLIKEEKHRLLHEIETLQGQLNDLQEARDGIRREDAVAMQLNAQLKEDVQRAWLLIAQWSNSLTGGLGYPPAPTRPERPQITPLSSSIHLPMDEDQRKRFLTAISQQKFEDAVEFILQRAAHVDVGRFHQNVETSELANGDFLMVRFDVTPLKRATSVKHALREMINCIGVIDISLSDTLGIVATRQTDDCAEMATSQCRMLATEPTGVQVESNVAMFVKYFDASRHLRRPHAVMVADHVDADDRHPYRPLERIRRDVMAVTLLTTVPAGGNDADDDEVTAATTGTATATIVTMIRWIFVRVHRPQFTVSEQARTNVREIIEKWCEVLPVQLAERLGA